MRTSFIAALLFGLAAFGQVVERSPIRNVVTYTTADVNLFVNASTGSDLLPCVSSAAPCLTIQGAVNKVPKHLRHRLTITIAAGNYAGFTLSGFTIDPSFQKTTMGILIDGTLGDITPATGTATGTATAGTAGSGVTYGTMADGAQTWTVNNLRGQFVVITGGTGSGQTRVICSNTATIVTICGTWTAPNATSTYALRAPTSVITSAAAGLLTPTGASILSTAAGIQLLDNSMQAGATATTSFIVIRNMGVSIAAGTAVYAIGDTNYQVTQAQLLTTNGLGINSPIAGTITSVTDSYITAGSNGIVSTHNRLGVLRSLINATSTCVNGAGSLISLSLQCIGMTLASSSAITVSVGTTGTLSGVRCDCGSTATSACVGNVTTPTSLGPSPINIGIVTGLDVTNCAYGVALSGGSVNWTSPSGGFSGNSLTNSVFVNGSGKVWLPSAITITSGTADLSIDNGASTETFSNLLSANSCLTGVGTSSAICRQ